LDDVLNRYDQHGTVPTIVQAIIETLSDEESLKIEGILRQSGNSANIIKLKKVFDEGKIEDLKKHDPNDVIGLLKLYFKELPEPLFTLDLYPEFVNLIKETNQNLFTSHPFLNDLRILVDKIPPSNKDVLAYIIKYMCQVAKHSLENKMTAGNISIVFGPTLLRSKENTFANFADIQYINKVIELLIYNHGFIFMPTIKMRVKNMPGDFLTNLPQPGKQPKRFNISPDSVTANKFDRVHAPLYK